MGEAKQGAGRQGRIGRKDGLTLFVGQETLDEAVDRVLLVNRVAQAAGNSGKFAGPFAIEAAQDGHGQEVEGVERGRRIAGQAEDEYPMAVIVDDAAVRGRAGPHGDAVVKLDGTEVLVNLGHRVIETDGNAASADDEVPALSQAADGSYFIG